MYEEGREENAGGRWDVCGEVPPLFSLKGWLSYSQGQRPWWRTGSCIRGLKGRFKFGIDAGAGEPSLPVAEPFPHHQCVTYVSEHLLPVSPVYTVCREGNVG
jgi:hypothetical protein